MPIHMLNTKFYAPRPRPGLVPRPRLTSRLDRGAESKLILVSAPAGFGKTTLIAEWLAADPAASANEQSAAWLSLDRSDNDPASFWTYVIAGIRTVEPGVGERAIGLLQEPPPFPMHLILTTLINDLNKMGRHVVLVLDDFHVIEDREVQDGVAFLLDHLPPRLHLVIASRADPALPLARLRARGELVETRATDLRFTAEEAAAYLNEMMGLELTPEDVGALEARTEGWIAALQLAALSIQGRDDVAGFIAGFAGDNRYIVDYLLEEVLQRQPEPVQAFLLETSILGRLSGALCDAVTGQDGGQAMLQSLDRSNMFLVPLDDSRRWYRYHHLFADVLSSRLLAGQPEHVPELHRRASAWYARNGEQGVAIDHALAAEDFDSAADLIELAVPTIRRDRGGARLRGWLGALPAAVVEVRPVLSVGYAGALLVGGELEGVESLLSSAERWMDGISDRSGDIDVSTAMVVVDEEEFRRLPSSIAVYRAAQSQALGDVAATVNHARRALDLVGEDDHLERGAASGFVALAAWSSGDLETAHRCYTECLTSLQRAGHGYDVLGGASILADIRIAQGRLGDAMRIYQDALELGAAQGRLRKPPTCTWA